ncbi:MRC2 protein, partial [Polypterus senegalus]|nr:MRC2 protein [Polypterus senegalus]
MTWTAAQNYCRNTAADLVTVYKEEDIRLLLSITENKEFWIGLHCDSDNWHWSNGEELTYSNWDRDLFCAFTQSNGSWSDSVCDKNKPFMCYNKTGNIMETYFWINVQMDWSRAQKYCRVNYTDLVSIRNESENQEIMKKAQGDNFWFGLFNIPWKWSDGGNSTFLNWTSGNPDNYNHAEKCVVNNYKGKGWNDANCNDIWTFFCTNKTLLHCLHFVLTDSTNINRTYFWISENMTWSNAQNYCRVNYTDLVSIRNETENEEVRNRSQSAPFWIGLFIGARKWSDGRTPSYQNWQPQEPDNFHHQETCMKVNTNGKLRNEDCKSNYSFFCSQSKVLYLLHKVKMFFTHHSILINRRY